MKTKGKGSKSAKKAYRPSPDSHTPNLKKPNLEFLEGVLIVQQVRGCLVFLKMVHMEE